MFETSEIVRLPTFIKPLLMYFRNYRLHDVDNNTKLDGLEILHALQHTMHENDEENTIQSDLDWIVGTSKFYIQKKHIERMREKEKRLILRLDNLI